MISIPDRVVVATANAHKRIEIEEILASFSDPPPGLLRSGGGEAGGTLPVSGRGAMGRGLSGIIVSDLSSAGAGLDPPEETGETFAENARIKAKYYATRLVCACLADDSGLCVDALGGRPGVYSSRYADSDAARIARLLSELDVAGAHEPAKRTARFVCAACLVTPDGEVAIAEGVCEGVIAKAPAGANGFGYDPVFFLPDREKTMAQLTADEKHTVSHRGRALRALFDVLSFGKSRFD